MSFWELFFILMIFIPLMLVWGFALFDIFRRHDLSGLAKAIWVAAVVLVPFIGTLTYLIVSSTSTAALDRMPMQATNYEYAPETRSGETTAQRLS